MLLGEAMRKNPQSDRFANWFRNSKVVNSDGTPKVVYHGTKAVFNEFLRPKQKGIDRLGPGFYFTDHPRTIEVYSESGGTVIPVFLRIENPITDENRSMTKAQVEKFFKEITTHVFPNGYNATADQQQIKQNALNDLRDAYSVLNSSQHFFDSDEFMRGMLAAGIDGIISRFGTEGHYEYVVFDNKQIKSATNNTEYDPNTADIFKNPYTWSVDYDAMGQVPYHASMDYHGTLIWLKPQLFLSLCNELPEESRRTGTVDYATQQWQSGGRVAPPQLYLAPKGSGWRVMSHEGRHRTTIAMLNGAKEVPVLVHMYAKGGGMIKGKYITPQLVESLRGKVLSEEFAKGKRYKDLDFNKYWIDGTLYTDGVAEAVDKNSVLSRNPPSPDFELLGEGSAAEAYRNKQLVEIIAKSKRGLYDVSRDVVIEARERLPANLKKYLPVINRKRVDKTRAGTLEFIYEMPFYNKITQGPEEPDSYTNYRKYGYEYPTEAEVRQIESVLNAVMREAYAAAGLPYVRDKAKFDGSYMDQDSLNCNPKFNLGWYTDGGKKIMVFRDPLFAWMPRDSVLALYGSKYPVDLSGKVSRAQSLSLGRYFASCLK